MVNHPQTMSGSSKYETEFAESAGVLKNIIEKFFAARETKQEKVSSLLRHPN